MFTTNTARSALKALEFDAKISLLPLVGSSAGRIDGAPSGLQDGTPQSG